MKTKDFSADTVSSCEPDYVHHEYCFTSDQLVLSAITNEKNAAAAGNSSKLFQFWADVVDVFFIGEGIDTELNRMNHGFERVITGRVKIESAFGGKREESGVILTDYDGTWDSKEHKALAALFNGVTSIMKVDWLDKDFPRWVPEDFALMCDGDQQTLEDMLNDRSVDTSFFHQLGSGVLDAYLQSAPPNSPFAKPYRALPRVATLYAFSSSNKCENIYTKEGRDRKLSHSNIYVLRSTY